jgi:hypothetical protein
LVYSNKAKLLVLLQDIQKQFKEEWEDVHHQSSQQMPHYTVIALIFSYLALKVFDIKVVELNELYIPYHVPLFCIMCHFVKNE